MKWNAKNAAPAQPVPNPGPAPVNSGAPNPNLPPPPPAQPAPPSNPAPVGPGPAANDDRHGFPWKKVAAGTLTAARFLRPSMLTVAKFGAIGLIGAAGYWWYRQWTRDDAEKAHGTTGPASDDITDTDEFAGEVSADEKHAVLSELEPAQDR